MATRGRIGVLRPDGRVESIYNHYDSYLDGLGAGLKKIITPEEVDELIKLGDRRGLYADEDWRDKKSLFNEPARFYESEEDFYNNDDDWSEYRYLYKDGRWNVSYPSGWERVVEPLVSEDEIKESRIRKPAKTPIAKSPLDLANNLLGDK